MYNDAIKVANKIISHEDLFEIFSKMNEKLMYYKKVYANEEMQNKMLQYGYQRWTFKDSNSFLSFNVNFYDDTSVKFDNYNNFISIFNSRLHEIKDIHVSYSLYYHASLSDGKIEYFHQHINMWIRETKADIEVSLSSRDNKINDVYEFIKTKILNAPEKYDYVIRKKSLINRVVGFAIGFIPALVISTLLLLVPALRELFANGYVLYPICCLILAFIIGGIASSMKLDHLYKTINPEQKHAGYDSKHHTIVYKDDIDKYVQTSEILIGKNVDNLKYRQQIMDCYNKYKKYLPYEIGIMLILSIVAIFLG